MCCVLGILHINNICALMNKSNTTSNNIGNEKSKCNIILEMLDCLYGLSEYGFSIDGLCCKNMNICVIFIFTTSVLCNWHCPFLFFLLFVKSSHFMFLHVCFNYKYE